MRRILMTAAVAVAGVVLIGGSALGAVPGAPGSDGGGGGNSGNGPQRGAPGAPGTPGGAPNPPRTIVVRVPEIRVGPNGKLGDDAHEVTLTARVSCTNNAAYTVQGKARQGETVGKGTTTLQCENGATEVVTVTVAAEGEFAEGQADGCVGLIRSGSGAKADVDCRQVRVIA